MRDKNRQKEKQHESYLRNKEKVLERNRLRRKKRKEWYKEFMKDKSCTICSENSPDCLEWHHVDPSIKKSKIADLVKSFYSMETIFEEMEKCIVVCSNCHRKIHAKMVGPRGIEPLLSV